jgi:tRNA(Met) C34 N-acetyltransferase TmcA
MVLQIFYRWKRVMPPGALLPRILITAPSNAAVDELVRKLMDKRQQMPSEERFNMMRIGKENMIHPEVQKISLEYLRDQTLKKEVANRVRPHWFMDFGWKI